MKKYLTFLFMLLLLAASCAASKNSKKNSERPDWLDNPESRYPAQTYISALGSGFSRSDAEQDAAGKLARIFRSDVQASETTELRYEELTRDASTSTEDYSKVTRNIQLKSQESLVNIQFGESYTDDMARVHVIAYLERYPTASIYEEMIGSNSRKVNHYLQQSQQQSDALYKYAYAGAAWMIAIKNEDLLRQVKIITPSLAEMINPDYEVNAVEQLYTESARNIDFSLNLQNDPERKAATIIERLLTQKGFKIKDSQAYLNISGDFDLQKTELQRDDDPIFYRWNLQLTISNPQGEIILTFNPKGRSGSISDSEAIARAWRDLEKELSKSLIRDFDRWFDNIVLQEK